MVRSDDLSSDSEFLSEEGPGLEFKLRCKEAELDFLRNNTRCASNYNAGCEEVGLLLRHLERELDEKTRQIADLAYIPEWSPAGPGLAAWNPHYAVCGLALTTSEAAMLVSHRVSQKSGVCTGFTTRQMLDGMQEAAVVDHRPPGADIFLITQMLAGGVQNM